MILFVCDELQEWGRKSWKSMYQGVGNSNVELDISSFNMKKIEYTEKIDMRNALKDQVIANIKRIIEKQYMLYSTTFRDGQYTAQREFDFIKHNAHNEEYIKSLIRPRIEWAGTLVVLVGKDTSKSDYVNWEIEYAAQKGKRIVGVYLPGESNSEIPEALNKYGDSLQKWNGESIISGIKGDNTWNGPERNWNTPRATC